MQGKRRMGRPRTEKERKERHEKLYGKGAKLPPRGTGNKGNMGNGSSVY